MPASAHRQGDNPPFETVLGQTIGDELLARRDVALKNLGVFRVVHRFPAQLDSPDGRMELTPPADEVTFMGRAGSANAGLRSEEMNLEGALVFRTGWMPHRVSAALGVFVQQAEERISEGGSCRIHGVGVLRRNWDGEWVFTPETRLALQVNHRYAGLKPVLLRDGDMAADTAGDGIRERAEEQVRSAPELETESRLEPEPVHAAESAAEPEPQAEPAHEHEESSADPFAKTDDSGTGRNGQAERTEWQRQAADPQLDRPFRKEATVPEDMPQWKAAPTGDTTRRRISYPADNRRLFITMAVVAVAAAGAASALLMPFPFSTADPDSNPAPVTSMTLTDAPVAAPLEPQTGPAQEDPAQPAPSPSNGPYGLFGTYRDDLPGRFAIMIHVGSDLDVLSEKAANLLSMDLRVHFSRVPEESEPTWLLSIGQFDLESDALEALERIPQQLAGEPLLVIELP